MLSKEEQIKLGAKVIGITYEEASKYVMDLPNCDAIYISDPVKGGGSVIVGSNGEVLYANSSVDYDVHVKEYQNGRRTPLDSVNNK